MRALVIAALLAGCHSVDPRPLSVDGLAVKYTQSVQTDTAMARWNDVPEIAINPTYWAGATPLQRQFTLAHELCHLEGHRGELSADCCAASKLEDWDVLTDSRLAKLALWIQSWDSGPSHPPGVHRAFIFLGCHADFKDTDHSSLSSR